MAAMALLIVLAACVFDLRTRRIPNLLTLGGSFAGVLTSGVLHGLPGAGLSLAGWAVGLGLFLPLFMLRGLGAGDVKLLACAGAWLGPVGVLWAALFTAIAGGVMALVVAGWAGYLRRAFSNLRLLLTHWAIVGIQPLPALTLQGAHGPRLAYALPIAAGVLVTLWLEF